MQQAKLPQSVLATTPLASVGAGISGKLAELAATLPEMPLPTGRVPAPPTQVFNFIKSVEEVLPTGAPKASSVLVTPLGGDHTTGKEPAQGIVPLIFE